MESIARISMTKNQTYEYLNYQQPKPHLQKWFSSY
jgi:hypothetical protein